MTLSLQHFLVPLISQRPKAALAHMEAVYFAWAVVSKDLGNKTSHPRLEPVSNLFLMSADEGANVQQPSLESEC